MSSTLKVRPLVVREFYCKLITVSVQDCLASHKVRATTRASTWAKEERNFGLVNKYASVPWTVACCEVYCKRTFSLFFVFVVRTI